MPRIMESVANELCREAELVDDAYYVLEARRTEGEAVPLPAINVIIEACAQLEDLDRAFATWGELEAFGLAPDVHTLTPTLPLPLPRPRPRPLPLPLPLPLTLTLTLTLTRRAAAPRLHLPYISPPSPLHLPYISPTSPLHLPYISPTSRLHLPYISPGAHRAGGDARRARPRSERARGGAWAVGRGA